MEYDGALVQDYLRRAHETSLLTDREKHLIGLAVTLTRGCQVCTRNRIKKARAAGIRDDILNALVDAVAAVNAGVAAATAREGFPLADEPLSEECGTLCSADVSAGPAGRPGARAEER
jgi:alkylhydroperoxidase/carboxymuconolactone decarboxylase family protein YurZ